MDPRIEALSRQVQIEAQREALLLLIILVVFIAIMFWLSYIVIKAAIRDGIKESGLVPTWAETVRKSKEQET